MSASALDPHQLAVIDLEGRPIRGAQPTKEAGMHAALYRARPTTRGVMHLHSTHAVAVSCLADIDERSALPPLTAYFAMRVGRLPPAHLPTADGIGYRLNEELADAFRVD